MCFYVFIDTITRFDLGIDPTLCMELKYAHNFLVAILNLLKAGFSKEQQLFL